MNEDSASSYQRATGYLELGMPEDALEELEAAPTKSSAILHLRVDVLFKLERWDQAAELCLPMTEREPEEAAWWIQAAYAVRRSRSIEEAEPVLRAAIGHHPNDVLICYNLACYTCLRGEHDEARQLLLRAIEADRKQVLKMATIDPDLEGIRPWIFEQGHEPDEA